MTIFRCEHKRNYTTVNNYIITDNRLSAKAKGIWLYAMSRPNDWTFYLNDIVNQSTDGKDAIKSGLKELQQFGYLEKDPARADDGKFANSIYVFYEEPKVKIISPQQEKPSTVKPCTVNPPLPIPEGEGSIEEEEKEDIAQTKKSSPQTNCAKANSPRAKRADFFFSHEKGTYEGISEDDLHAWKILFPSIDIRREMLASCQWLKSNPSKAKKSNWRKFLTGWLGRCEEKTANKAAFSSAGQTDRRTKNTDGSPVEAKYGNW